MRPHLYPSVAIGMKRCSDAPITNFLCGSVGSSHMCIPKFWHWFRFISIFPILFTKYKPSPKHSIITWPESIVNAVTPEQIGIFTYFVYSGRNVDLPIPWGPPVFHGTTCVNDGVVAHTCGHEGLSGQVCNHVLQLIVMRHDEAVLFKIQGV